MPNPPFVTDFDSGEIDEDKFAWSTRIPESAHQFLLDLMSDYQIVSKSKTLRMIVAFASDWFKYIAKMKKAELSERVRTRIELNQQLYERRQRDADKRLLIRLTTDIANESNPLLRAKLVKSASEFAKARNLNWPPIEGPTKDFEANYLFDKILEELDNQNVSRVSVRMLQLRTGWSKEGLMTVLDRLAQDELVRLEYEKRRGPKTIWISTLIREQE